VQKLEQQLAAAQAAAEAASQQATAASELAEARLREKASADKEWGRRLAAKDKEAAAKLREAEGKLKELEEKGELHGRGAAEPETSPMATPGTLAWVNQIGGVVRGRTKLGLGCRAALNLALCLLSGLQVAGWRGLPE